MADDKSPQVISVCIIFFVLSWTFVSLRIFVRAGMIKAFRSDDWTMLAAQLLFTGYLGCQLGGYLYGTGRLLEDLSRYDAETAIMVRMNGRFSSVVGHADGH